MRQKPKRFRIAAAALGASVVLPFTPAPAQDAPVVSPPPPVLTPAPPVSTAPPPAPAPSQPPPVQVAPLPPVSAPVDAPEAENRPTARPAPARAPAPARPAAQPRAPAPVGPAEPVAVEPAPLPEMLEPLAVETSPPLTAPEPIEPAEPSQASAAPIWPWVAAGAALLLALLALFGWRRRRVAAREIDGERAYVAPNEPAPAAMPVAPPAAGSAHDADPDDLAAMAASSRPEAGRPWLEFLMRPVRAGTDADRAVVEFELTVGNTGSVPARDVRISTWMVAAGDASEMERGLIAPPAAARRITATIEPGDGTQVDAAIALPKEELRGKVLPVVVADARYTLPDGSEGRTSASFAVGLANGEALEPFAVDLPTGLREDVEARLHGEPQRV
jgi:MYXO-CTERM domain-containing protein